MVTCRRRSDAVPRASRTVNDTWTSKMAFFKIMRLEEDGILSCQLIEMGILLVYNQ